MEETISMQGPICPVPLPHSEHIVIGHGSGGRMSQDLIRNTFLPSFRNPALNKGNDAANVSPTPCAQLAISTDAHVVYPLFFPGGDIGKLAICGTVNDVSMLGAAPLYLTASFILEEGLSINILEKIVFSMKEAASEAGVEIIAGDTKVVQKGKADGLYISTTGVGTIYPGVTINGANAQPGDKVIISGFLGDHGIAVLGARNELGFETDIKSDIAPLNKMVAEIINVSAEVHVLRDPTRGGLATTLNEIADQSGVCIRLYEKELPIRPEVAATSELLGFDPLYIANEGKLVVIVSAEEAEIVLDTIKKNKYGAHAKIIGDVAEEPANRVLMKTTIGATRIVDTLAGELLPRIC